jgi:hypothetical protein
LPAVLAAADLLTVQAALDSGAPDAGTESLWFVGLPNGFDRVLADRSAAGPVAWLRGEVVLGPLGVAPASG